MERRILEILNEVNEEIIAYDGNNMYEEGIVTSVEVLDIVSMLEDEFDFEMAAEDIIAKNFASKESIIELVQRYLNQ